MTADWHWADTGFPRTEYDEDAHDIVEYDEDGRPWAVDSDGNEYRPDAGAPEPMTGRCNAVLSNWQERYGEKRYCGRYQNPDISFCEVHKARADISVRAAESLQHGLHTKTLDHLYAHIDPWQKVFAHGLREDLMADSIYEFAEEYDGRRFDFSEAEFVPTVPEEAIVAEGPIVRLDVAYPTEKIDRAMALWAAALDTIKMVNVQQKVLDAEMETTSVEHASLTAPTEDDPTQTFQTIEEVSEHHLNLPYSRLVKDRKELLKYGGVPVEGETTADGRSGDFTDVDFDDLAEDIEAEPETFRGEDGTPESERMREFAADGDGG